LVNNNAEVGIWSQIAYVFGNNALDLFFKSFSAGINKGRSSFLEAIEGDVPLASYSKDAACRVFAAADDATQRLDLTLPTAIDGVNVHYSYLEGAPKPMMHLSVSALR
jgi:hypothetical protein